MLLYGCVPALLLRSIHPYVVFFPLFLDPWEHVLGMGLGVVFVNQLVKWDEKLKEDLDKMLERAKQANERRYFGSCSFPPTFLEFSFLLFCYAVGSARL